jgi:hypothetical protein
VGLGCVLKGADLDVVVHCSLSQARHRLREDRWAVEESGREDILRVQRDGIQVDFQEEEEGGAAAKADVEKLLQLWGEDLEAVRESLLFLKLYFGHRMATYGTVCGYPNGLALAVMVSVVLRQTPPDQRTAEALVERFFEYYKVKKNKQNRNLITDKSI